MTRLSPDSSRSTDNVFANVQPASLIHSVDPIRIWSIPVKNKMEGRRDLFQKYVGFMPISGITQN